jgi:hypothetical protein
VSQEIRTLLETIAAAPTAQAADEERLQWLGAITARLVAALAPFCDEPNAILPAQRALLVLAGRPSRPPADLSGLSRALRQIDERLGRDQGGFSRLLDAALTIDEPLRPLAVELERTGRELLAVDDLAHALSCSTELVAGALVLEAALDLATSGDGLSHGDAVALGTRWIKQRGLSHELVTLLEHRDALETLDNKAVSAMGDEPTARAFAIWIIAHRVASGERLEDATDRPAIAALLERAGLIPLEVFDAASLWRELGGE